MPLFKISISILHKGTHEFTVVAETFCIPLPECLEVLISVQRSKNVSTFMQYARHYLKQGLLTAEFLIIASRTFGILPAYWLS